MTVTLYRLFSVGLEYWKRGNETNWVNQGKYGEQVKQRGNHNALGD